MKRLVWVFFPLLLLSPRLRADGGKLILNGTSGDETLSVFVDPFPLRVYEPADFSVLVQHGSEPVLKGSVTVTLGGTERTLTHAAATNKLLFAGTMTPSAAGDVAVTAIHGNAVVRGVITVHEQLPGAFSYWPFAALVPVGVGLFALNRHLQRSRQRTTSA